MLDHLWRKVSGLNLFFFVHYSIFFRTFLQTHFYSSSCRRMQRSNHKMLFARQKRATHPMQKCKTAKKKIKSQSLKDHFPHEQTAVGKMQILLRGLHSKFLLIQSLWGKQNNGVFMQRLGAHSGLSGWDVHWIKSEWVAQCQLVFNGLILNICSPTHWS